MSVEIEARALHVSADEGRIPLESAAPAEELNEHIHAELVIRIDGRGLPRMGFFGPGDVCLDSWARELVGIRAALGAGDARYEYDEGEQGQPSFVFERSGSWAYVSVEASDFGGGERDPDWQRVRCEVSDLLEAIDRFFAALRDQTTRSGPYGALWWREKAEKLDLEP